MRDAPFWEWARTSPDHPVYRLAGQPVTAGVLAGRVDRLVGGLLARGMRPGDACVLAGTAFATTVETYLAAMRLGLRLVPVPAGTDAAAGGLVVTPETYDSLLAEPSAHVGTTAGSVVAPGRPGRAAQPVSPDAAATQLCISADAMGFTPGGEVAFGLPHLDPVGLAVLGALIHSRRPVHVPDGGLAALAALLAEPGVTDLVAARSSIERLAQYAVASGEQGWRPQRVLSLGPPGGDLRAAAAAAFGGDVLVEYGQAAAGLQALEAPPASGLAGFWSWARAEPDRAAMVTPDGAEISAGDLLARAERLAGTLADAAGDGVVAVLLRDQADVLLGYLAAIRAGVVFVAISPDLPEHAQVLANARPAVVVTADPSPEVLAAAGGALVADVVTLLAGPERPRPGGAAGSTLQVTSGTTGVPKLVHAPQPAAWTPELKASAERATAARLGFAGPGAHLVTGTLDRGAVLGGAVAALHAGETLVLTKGWSAAGALELLAEREITSAFLVPAMFEGLLALPADVRRRWRPRALRTVVHGTAPCPVETKRAMIDWWGPVLVERYGSSEGAMAYVTSAEWLDRPGTVGKPFPGVDLRVLDEEGRPVPPGEQGFVYRNDSGVHYDDGSAPARRTAGLMSVGDIGYVDDEGWLFLCGRATDYLSVGGDKFHPSLVERVLAGHPAVADCAVAALPSRVLGSVVVAYVVPAGTEEAPEVARSVLRYSRETLPPSRRPIRVHVVPALPYDSLGKLRRRELRAPDA